MKQKAQPKEMIDAEVMIQESEPSVGVPEERTMANVYFSPASSRGKNFKN